MTEDMHGLSSNPDQSKPGEFEMPSDSVLIAEATRDFYESMFISQMNSTSDLPTSSFNDAERNAAIQARVAIVRMYLTSPVYDPQAVIDEIDIVSLAEGTVTKTTKYGIATGEVEVEPYQLENYIRTSANLSQEIADPEVTKTSRRHLVKRFGEARKLALERGVSEEDVYSDQQLYFELIRRSTSPEDIIAQTREWIKNYRAIANSLVVHEYRAGMLVLNADNNEMSVEEINDQTAKFAKDPGVLDEIMKTIGKVEEYMHANALLLIERYWGPETATLFR